MCKDAVYVCFVKDHRKDLAGVVQRRSIKYVGLDIIDSIGGKSGSLYLIYKNSLEQFKFKDKVTDGGRLVKHIVSKI